MKRKAVLCIVLIVFLAVSTVLSEPVTFSFYDSQRSFDDFIVKGDFDDIDAYMMINDGEVHYWLFTKTELLDILSAAGLTHRKFYYPLPDYRLPQFVFTDAALPEPSVSEVLLPYDPTPDTRILSEGLLFTDVVQNGLFPAMANSFLVECGMTEDFCLTDSASIACDRAPEYNIATCRERNTYIKKPVMAPAKQGICEIAENLEALRHRGLDVVPCDLQNGALIMPRFDAPTMASWLQTATAKDRDAVLAAMERLWAAILQSSPPVPDAEKNT